MSTEENKEGGEPQAAPIEEQVPQAEAKPEVVFFTTSQIP